jgi:WD40 repeat protein
VSGNHGLIRLINPENGRTLAILGHPSHVTTSRTLAFSPDGRFLAAPNSYGNEAAQVWDLTALRKELQAMGLDWAESSIATNIGDTESESQTDFRSRD